MLGVDWATGSSNLWAHRSCVHVQSVCQSRHVIWRWINSLTLLATTFSTQQSLITAQKVTDMFQSYVDNISIEPNLSRLAKATFSWIFSILSSRKLEYLLKIFLISFGLMATEPFIFSLILLSSCYNSLSFFHTFSFSLFRMLIFWLRGLEHIVLSVE